MFYVCNHGNLAGGEIEKVHVYPGQNFKVQVVLHGQRNGSVPGLVHASLFESPRGAHLGPLQETQETGYLCENLTYTLSSLQEIMN